MGAITVDEEACIHAQAVTGDVGQLTVVNVHTASSSVPLRVMTLTRIKRLLYPNRYLR